MLSTTLNFSTISLSTISRECKRKNITFGNEREQKEQEERRGGDKGNFSIIFDEFARPKIQAQRTKNTCMIDAHMIDD